MDELPPDALKRHGLRYEYARILLQHGATPIQVSNRTGLPLEAVDHLAAERSAPTPERSVA